MPDTTAARGSKLRRMVEQAITQPNATTYLLEDILTEVARGRVRIPDFQRQFRWQWEDARRLLESIVRGYPIGSLLLWARPAEQQSMRLGALHIDAPAVDEALWVVDGQQRLTSLANALNDAGVADSRFSFAYQLPEKKFARVVEGEAHSVPLPVIFDLQRLLRWFASHPESADHFDEATRIAKAIRQYSIPAYIVKQRDEATLRDIFDRMNNYGKRLTRAEVFSALHSGHRGSGPPRTLSEIVEHVDSERGFGQLDEDTVLRAVLARRGADVTREIRVEFDSSRVSREFANETPDEAYVGGDEALLRAVAFLQDDAGVPHFGFLPYRYLLVVLTRFFAHFPDAAPRNRQLLRRWFWRAATAGPLIAKGSWTGAMGLLSTRVRPGDESGSVQGLLDVVSSAQFPQPAMRKFRIITAETRALLCALWSLKPRSVMSGIQYDRATLGALLSGKESASEAICKLYRKEPSNFAGSSGNRIILIGDEVEVARARFGERPSDLDEVTWLAVLASHGMNADMAGSLAADDAASFLRERERWLTAVLQGFVASMSEREFEDTPPLEVLDIEDEADGRDDALDH